MTAIYTWDHRNRLVGASGSLGAPYPEDDGEETAWGWGSSSASGSIAVDPALGQGTGWGWGSSSGIAHSSGVIDIDYAAPGNPYGTSGDAWTSPNHPTTTAVNFTTADNFDFELTESFEIHVRVAGDSGPGIVIEADIFDKDQPTYPDGTVEFLYDPFDRLIGRVLDPDGPAGPELPVSTFYSWENGQIVLEFDGPAASDLSHRYLWGPAVDQLLADEDISSVTQPGAILWPLADHLGTIRDIAEYDTVTNATTVANHRRYDSFGKLLSQTDGGPTLSFGFTGLLFETLTGLQYNRARWYDPRIGQFVSKDPISFAAGDTNLRRYVGNAPTMYTDPSGLDGPPGTGPYGSGRPTRPPKPGTFFHDWWYFVPPWTNPAKRDTVDYFLGTGKWAGWATAAVAGTAAGGIAIAEAAGAETMGITIVRGGPQGFHMAWQVGGKWCHATGVPGFMTAEPWPFGPVWGAGGYWNTITGIPIRNAAGTIFSGNTTNCVTGVVRALGGGWGLPIVVGGAIVPRPNSGGTGSQGTSNSSPLVVPR